MILFYKYASFYVSIVLNFLLENIITIYFSEFQ